MEQVLNKILEELNSINAEINGIKSEINGVKSEINGVKSEINGMNCRLNKLEEGQAEIKLDVKEINRKTSIIFDETANLAEFTTSATDSLNRIEENISAVEKVTAKNCYDITHLKAIK